ncbi:DUF4276 family protein [Cysteiniphilum sp. 6C5]|uniref:DUF4276 family protein n=1 Tax=unclassified Cysteiniphilum TaxID=2610889 RepID=UPI003F84F33E
MSNYIEVMTIVEGRTEQTFIEKVVQPYLAPKNIFIRATQVSKPGQKGGDVRFERVKQDIAIYLKQRSDIYVTTMIDYYGIKEWPGIADISQNYSIQDISKHLNERTISTLCEDLPQLHITARFIPYMVMHEFEALLFSDSSILAQSLNIDEHKITKIVEAFSTPEAINNSRETAPSKRLDGFTATGKFAKTTTGIAIAMKIGIPCIREKCFLFNEWLESIENLIAAKNA